MARARLSPGPMTDQVWAALCREARRDGTPVGALIRDAIDRELQRRKRKAAAK